MRKANISSTLMKAVAWVKSELIIIFHNGKVFRYPSATESHYNDMVVSPSAGSYFHQHIKSQHKGVEVTDPKEIQELSV